MLRAIARLDLLILDDWGPEPLDADQRRDLLEIVEDRYEARSIIVTSQLPVDRWYEIIGNSRPYRESPVSRPSGPCLTNADVTSRLAAWHSLNFDFLRAGEAVDGESF
jgi:DNA replication protein DnaC